MFLSPIPVYCSRAILIAWFCVSSFCQDFITHVQPSAFFGLHPKETLASLLIGIARTSTSYSGWPSVPMPLAVVDNPRSRPVNNSQLESQVRLANFHLLQLVRPEMLYTIRERFDFVVMGGSGL